MNRYTLPELYALAEDARRRDYPYGLVEPVTLRSLVEATSALLRLGEAVELGFVTLDDDELERAIEVARARFVEPYLEPTSPAFDPAMMQLARDRARAEAVGPGPSWAGPSDSDRLAAEVAELKRRVRAVLPAWRHAWRRGRS